MTEVKSSRIQAIDILRGMTIAGMILVNNPGGEPVYTPLEHAESTLNGHGSVPAKS